MYRPVTSLIALFLICVTTAFGQSVDIMTFNLRYSTSRDGVNSWDNRKEFVAHLLNYYEPDVFGVQEALHSQMVYLDTALHQYTYVGVGRDDGKEKGEYSGVFYRKDKYKAVKEATFWLSDKPNKPSVGWDASMERISTYVLLEDRESQKRFWVFNTHFDHKGVEARKESAQLILQQIQKKNKKGYPVFLTGDLNLVPEETPITLIKKQMADSYEVSELKPYGPLGTFNGFDFERPLKRRIDYIFVSAKNIVVEKYRTIDDFLDFRYPSDHMPVLISCRFKE